MCEIQYAQGTSNCIFMTFSLSYLMARYPWEYMVNVTFSAWLKITTQIHFFSCASLTAAQVSVGNALICLYETTNQHSLHRLTCLLLLDVQPSANQACFMCMNGAKPLWPHPFTGCQPSTGNPRGHLPFPTRSNQEELAMQIFWETVLL